jgi:hypothetical protein
LSTTANKSPSIHCWNPSIHTIRPVVSIITIDLFTAGIHLFTIHSVVSVITNQRSIVFIIHQPKVSLSCLIHLQSNLSPAIYMNHYFFSLQVAMISKTSSEIRPGKELWKIKARITRMWDAILLGSGKQISLDIIFIDHQE